MKDIKTKEVTTKPKTKNPASRIPKELMRTAILESKEKIPDHRKCQGQ